MKWEFDEAGIPWEPFGERADRLEATTGRIEWHVLAQLVVETADRRAAAEAVLERYGATMTADELLDTPFVLIGTVEEMAGQIIRNRERFGYYTVHGPYMEAFAPVIERVRAEAAGGNAGIKE
jgi:hypothetical protein